MTDLRFLLALTMGVFGGSELFAGVEFTGGWVESRAYSGLTPIEPIVRVNETVEELPFLDGTHAASGATLGNVDYSLATSNSGAAFQWDVVQVHDGALESFATAEGELRFRVDEPVDFELAGDYAYSGEGVKRNQFWLYTTQQDSNPVFEWLHIADGSEPGATELSGFGELVPGIDYRLVYRFLLDNRTVGDVGAVAGSARFLIGEPVSITQPGDANGDGRVDLTDLNLVRNHFGASGEDVPGDTAPFDGTVDLGDLNAVRNHFGESLPAGVPEPSSAALLGAGLLAACAWRFRTARRG